MNSERKISISDPFELHEKLKRNMILYLEADPEMINHTDLAQRLETELKTIRPSKMMPQMSKSRPSSSHIPIPISTKKSIISETSEMVNFYESANFGDGKYSKKLEESFEDFLIYLKGLKNKFLEDLIMGKVNMVEDEHKKLELVEKFPPINLVSYRYESDKLSNRVLIEDTNFEDLKEFEKEVDNVISEEGSINIFNQDEISHTQEDDFGEIKEEKSVSDTDSINREGNLANAN
jgi:hypothetical protein